MGYVSNTHGLSVDAPSFKLVGEATSFLSACDRAYVSFGVAILSAATSSSVQSKTSTALFTPNATTKYVEPGIDSKAVCPCSRVARCCRHECCCAVTVISE